MIRQFSRAFSTAKGLSGEASTTGIFEKAREFLAAPVKHIKRNLEPTGQDYNPMLNTTSDAFDEVSQEWQALVVGNPYDVNTFNMLEQAMM